MTVTMIKRCTKVDAFSATGHRMPGHVVRPSKALAGWYLCKGEDEYGGRALSVHESQLRATDNRPNCTREVGAWPIHPAHAARWNFVERE